MAWCSVKATTGSKRNSQAVGKIMKHKRESGSLLLNEEVFSLFLQTFCTSLCQAMAGTLTLDMNVLFLSFSCTRTHTVQFQKNFVVQT